MTYDAGIYNTNVHNNNSIGDKAWDDTDKDGIQHPSESGVSCVTVTLYDNTNTPIAVTSTDTNGMYLFPFEGVWLGGLLGQRVVIAD